MAKEIERDRKTDGNYIAERETNNKHFHYIVYTLYYSKPICLSLPSNVNTEMNTLANNEEHRKSSERVQVK
jgi:hypothetical protein